MGDTSNGEQWLSDALFQVESVLDHKTRVDASLTQSEVLERIGNLSDRQKLSLIEVMGTKGTEYFSRACEEVTGTSASPGLEYLFLSAIREVAHAVVRSTDDNAQNCHYCATPVDPDSEDACKQATLWVSGAKWQNTRLRRYTGAWAHKSCVEDKAERPDSTQEHLEF